MHQLSAILPLLFFPLASTAPHPSPSEWTTSSPSATTLSPETQEQLFSLHEQLVNIPSTSLEEIACANFVFEYLTSLNYHVEEVSVDSSGRYNVFAYPTDLHEQGIVPEVLITSHIDTVPPHIPFSRLTINNTTYHHGRGTVDAKGPVASMITASHAFFQSRSNANTPSLGMLFVVGEEIGGDGMKAFASQYSNTTFRAAIFGEPTEAKLATGHKGSVGVTLDVTGRAAHSAYPWLGVNAIDFLAEGIQALNDLEEKLPASEELGNSTLNVGLIAGGLAGNIVPPNATATVFIRVARSEADAPDVIKAMVEEALAPVIQRAADANATFNVTFSQYTYPAQILDTDVPGLEAAPVFYGTDIPNLPQVGKRYLYGTGTIEVAHTPEEMLSQGELVEAAEAYRAILEHLLPEE